MKAMLLSAVRNAFGVAVGMTLSLLPENGPGNGTGADSDNQPEKPAAKHDAKAVGEDFPFGKLPFRLQPFTQPGSDNILPAITKKMAGKWGLGQAASIVEFDGSSCLRLVPKQGGGLTVEEIGVTPEHLYNLEFEYKYSDDARFKFAEDGPGLHGWMVMTAPDNKEGPGTFRIYQPRKTARWQPGKYYFHTRAGVKTVRLNLDFVEGLAGAVYVKDLRSQAVPVEATDGLRLLTAGENTWAEVPHRKEAPPPAAAVLYHRVDPDELFPWSTPAQEDINQPVKWQGTAGEVVVSGVGLWTPKIIDKVTLKLTALRSDSGQTLEPKFEWFAIQYLPRATGERSSPQCTFFRSADFFLARPEGVPCAAGETTAFWLKLTLPADGKAGAYNGFLRAEGKNGLVQSLPVRINVYPFKLDDVAGKRWGLYADSERWRELDDKLILLEMCDIKAHGIDCLVLDTSGQAVWQGQKITGWTLGTELTRYVSLAQQAGLRGPLVIDWWGQHERLAEKLDVSQPVMEGSADKWPANLAATYRTALNAFDAEWKKQGWPDWAYAGVDEPGYWKKDSPALFRFQYDAAQDAGLKTFCTSTYSPRDPLGRPLTYHCAEEGAFARPDAALEILKEAKEAGQQMWVYNSGCYVGQVGNLRRNRYATGFQFHNFGTEATVSWTFQRPVGDNAFNDFSEVRGRQWCIVLPDPEHPGQNLDTPQWEAIRQGWLDYRYAATLARAIERARQRAATTDLAAQVESEFTALLQEMPWAERGAAIQEASNRNCNDWRARIAAAILKLESR